MNKFNEIYDQLNEVKFPTSFKQLEVLDLVDFAGEIKDVVSKLKKLEKKYSKSWDKIVIKHQILPQYAGGGEGLVLKGENYE